MAEGPEVPPCKKLCLCGTDLSTLSKYHLSGSKHKRLMARDGAKTLKAVFSASLLSLRSDSAVAKSEQKELDKEFRQFLNLVEVSQSTSG